MEENEPQAMQQDSSPSDDSDSDFVEVEASPEDMELMMQLENDLQANPNLYDLHVQVSTIALSLLNKIDTRTEATFLQYVSVLRKCKLREKLRSARQSMQERYPLTESL